MLLLDVSFNSFARVLMIALEVAVLLMRQMKVLTPGCHS